MQITVSDNVTVLEIYDDPLQFPDEWDFDNIVVRGLFERGIDGQDD